MHGILAPPSNVVMIDPSLRVFAGSLHHAQFAGKHYAGQFCGSDQRWWGLMAIQSLRVKRPFSVAVDNMLEIMMWYIQYARRRNA